MPLLERNISFRTQGVSNKTSSIAKMLFVHFEIQNNVSVCKLIQYKLAKMWLFSSVLANVPSFAHIEVSLNISFKTIA